MKSSQSLSKLAATAKPAPVCAFPGCRKSAHQLCGRCLGTRYCSAKHQAADWKYHKKLCVAPQKKMSAPVPPPPAVPLKGSVDEEEKYEEKCVICLDSVPDAQLVRNDGFNEYFQKQFNGNEATYLRWKEVFDVLEIVGGRGIYYTVRESMEQQMLRITRSEDLVKLRALTELCSPEFFDDKSLLVVAWRRIFEVLELAMLEEKKVRGMKKKKKDSRKLEVLDACYTLGMACNRVRDMEDAMRYLKRAKEGFEEQLGRDSEKALDATHFLIICNKMSTDEYIKKLRDLLKRCERVLGEENVATLSTLNTLGVVLEANEEYEEAKEVYERCLAGGMKVLGEDHKDTLGSLNNLGTVYQKLKNYEKALEYYEKDLEGSERLLGKNHPSTLDSVQNIANVHCITADYGKAEELYQRALDGYEAQLGKDQKLTKDCAWNFRKFLLESGNEERLTLLLRVHPNVENY